MFKIGFRKAYTQYWQSTLFCSCGSVKVTWLLSSLENYSMLSCCSQCYPLCLSTLNNACFSSLLASFLLNNFPSQKCLKSSLLHLFWPFCLVRGLASSKEKCLSKLGLCSGHPFRCYLLEGFCLLLKWCLAFFGSCLHFVFSLQTQALFHSDVTCSDVLVLVLSLRYAAFFNFRRRFRSTASCLYYKDLTVSNLFRPLLSFSSASSFSSFKMRFLMLSFVLLSLIAEFELGAKAWIILMSLQTCLNNRNQQGTSVDQDTAHHYT